MTFIKRMSQGYHVTRDAFSLAWRKKMFNLYTVLAFISVGFFIFLKQLLRVESSLFHPVREYVSAIFLGQFSSIFLSMLIVNIFFAAFLYKFFDKNCSFFKSFSIVTSIIRPLLWWVFVSSIWSVIQIYSPIESGITIEYNIDSGFSYAFSYSAFIIWILFFVLYLSVAYGFFFVVTVLVKRRKTFLFTLKESFVFAYSHLVAIAWAYITLMLFLVFLLITIVGVCGLITWILSVVFSVPLGMRWAFLMSVVTAGPLLFYGIYALTSYALLPPMLYEKLRKK